MSRIVLSARAALAPLMQKRLHLSRHALLVLILSCSLQAVAASEAIFRLPAARDLAADGAAQKLERQPVVILFTRTGCHWCERIKAQHLRHLPGTLPLREVQFDSDAPLIDFSGRTTTQREFAAAQKFRLAPTLAFFGPTGQLLAEPIIGMRGADFMDHFIDSALAESRKRLITQ